MARKDVPTRLVCMAVAEHVAQGFEDPDAHARLVEWTGEPAKVCLRALERDEERGYIEYGHSIYGAWLTQKGKDLLSVADKSGLSL